MGVHQTYYLPDDYILKYIRDFQEFREYKYLGAHSLEYGELKGVSFMVHAPGAVRINLSGQFNNWDGSGHPLKRVSGTSLWHIFISGLDEMQQYKYEIFDRNQCGVFKADPYGFYSQIRPDTASIHVSLEKYKWKDADWAERKAVKPVSGEKINIYEVHLGSWRRKENGVLPGYRELADELLDYVISMGYTHIELLPIMEHPFDGSWGYQVTGYFAVTSRYGTPEDFMYFVDQCHQKEIGIILDWVPGHFCKDEQGLRRFDGTSLYEYDNPDMAENLQWGTLSFDLGKQEVIRFLISNALFWFDMYHVDGLRVDAVSYMLYLDAGRPDGMWMPNEYGGRENLSAIRFFRKLNETVHEYYPNSLMIAEEASAWPGVTGDPRIGGLGFDLKWDMGWMNDVLKYMEKDPVYRKWHHHLICFSFVYAYSEKFILALSHDEVVHGKKSMLNRMPGDYRSKFANLRALYGYMMGHPGKKLLFMGGEFGQFIEWDESKGLDWLLLNYESHSRLQQFVSELNHFYRDEKSLYELDHDSSGFEWIDSSNCDESIISFIRKAIDPKDFTIVICNFTPVVRQGYKIGVPCFCEYTEVFNSDLVKYGGQGIVNDAALCATELKWNNQPYSIEAAIPPLSTIFLKPVCQTDQEAVDQLIIQCN